MFDPANNSLPNVVCSENWSSHYSSNCGTSPEYGKSVMNQMISKPSPSGEDDSRGSPVMSGDRSEQEYEDSEEIVVPRINSSGKVKTFRCRQCKYVAITKTEFWKHNRTHIKAEKLLACPKCPFVTEYKHHLEYHLRNHFGSKPFKCEKCQYTCVNKSMLNSHLKSHSNVYQYRCADCAYATKYCHSLKLHLRKYTHEPAMVLNADGSPNPLPIIDVYGTRRGPKQKSLRMQEEGQYEFQGHLNNDIMNALHSSILSSQMMVPGSMPSMTDMMTALSYNPILSNIPLMSSLFGANPVERAMNLEAFTDYVKSMNGNKIPEDFLTNNFFMRHFHQQGAMTPSTTTIEVPENNERLISSEEDHIVEEALPLDLSVPNPTSQEKEIAPNCSKLSSTNRRKGKAVRLDQQVMEEESDDEQDQERVVIKSEPGVHPEYPEKKEFAPNDSNGMNNEFFCQYCGISFGNDVMYSVHMGYHGYQNPYTCNMCGHQCTDKVSFFLHIAQSKH